MTGQPTALYLAAAIDDEGAMYVARRWRCTETEAREYFDRYTMHADILVGHGGRILATR